MTGEASDPDGTVQSYLWEQVAGEPVPIGNALRPTAQFVAPVVDAPTTLTLRLTATDDGGAAASGEVTVAVELYGNMSISVSGTIRNHAAHVPISGASVMVSQYSDGLSQRVGQTDTDANGGYAVQALVAPGRLPPTDFTGPAIADFRMRKKRTTGPPEIAGPGRHIPSTRAFHSIGVHFISALKLSNEKGPPH